MDPTLLPRVDLETMDPTSLFSMSRAGRREWYVNKLEAYDPQLTESSIANHIPKRLLAAYILNELADIDWKDILQRNVTVGRTIGMAQIPVDYAIDLRLVSYPDPVEELEGRAIAHSRAQIEAIVRDRLWIPQYNIEAAGRWISIILDRMSQHSDKELSKFVFKTHPPSGTERKKNPKVVFDVANEPRLVIRAVSMASDAPGVIESPNPLDFNQNAYNNGVWASQVFEDLVRENLFSD